MTLPELRAIEKTMRRIEEEIHRLATRKTTLASLRQTEDLLLVDWRDEDFGFGEIPTEIKNLLDNAASMKAACDSSIDQIRKTQAVLGTEFTRLSAIAVPARREHLTP